MIAATHEHSSQQNLPDGKDCDAYVQAVSWCRDRASSGHDMMFARQIFHSEIRSAARDFGMAFEAIHSLFRNAHVSHMKRTSHIIKSQTTRHVQSYLNGTSILDIAKKVNYPPSMMARLIVENVALSPASNSSDGKQAGSTVNSAIHRKFITEAVRYPEKELGDAASSVSPEYIFSEKKVRGMHKESDSPYIPLSRLSLEVREAVDSDPMYGPRHDKIRHNIGIEYELLLEQMLHSMRVPFETEEELRARGTARTPDVLLSCPLGLKVPKRDSSIVDMIHESQVDTEDSMSYDWKMICWIDSKALYGDVDTHTNSVLPQVESYVHRFGPGLVVYWFGHAPMSKLGDSHGDVIIMDDLPNEFMLPTGECRFRN